MATKRIRKFRKAFRRKAFRRTGGVSRRIQFGMKKARTSRFMRRSWRMIQATQEVKTQSDGLGNVTLSGWNHILAPAINQGTNDESRIGNKIFVRYVKFKAYITSPEDTSQIRVMRLVEHIPKIPPGSIDYPSDMHLLMPLTQTTLLRDRNYVFGADNGSEGWNTSKTNPMFVERTYKIMKSVQYSTNAATLPWEYLPVFSFWSPVGGPYPNYATLAYSYTITYTDS